MKTEREQALDVLQSLPEGATFVDVMYELDVLRRRLRGIDGPADGEDGGRDELVRRLRERISVTGSP